MPDWRQLREQYGALVWATVYRILGNQADAADCFQDVFAEVLERSSPEAVRDWAAFLRWLAVRRALHPASQETEGSGAASRPTWMSRAWPTDSHGPVAEAEWNELVERVRMATAQLPGQQGEAFWLRSIEQMNYPEIGEQLGVDTNTVGVLLRRARLRLRKMLADLNPVKHPMDA